MTPAERARQIEKQEFEAECAAIRRRAYERLGMPSPVDERVKQWLAKPYEPSKPPRPLPFIGKQADNSKPNWTPRRPAKLRTVAGTSLTLRQWADYLGITLNALHQRIRRNGSLEAVVARYLHGEQDQ